MPTDGKVSETPKYLIGTVTKRTGLSADVVRVWERRYGAVRPARSGGGTRLYSDADILRLRRLRRVVEQGHNISQAARLSETELDELLVDTQRSGEEADPSRAFRDRIVGAVRRMDVATADHELARAATLFPPGELIKRIIQPILHELGERRAGGELAVANERLAQELVRNMLGSLFRVYHTPADAKIIVLATPASEQNNLALLLGALLAATHGWRPVYLGADVPAADIARAVLMTNARVLLMNFAWHHPQTREQLRVIADLLAPSTHVWVFGAEASRETLERDNWTVFKDLDDLDDRLRGFLI